MGLGEGTEGTAAAAAAVALLLRRDDRFCLGLGVDGVESAICKSFARDARTGNNAFSQV